MLDTRHAIRVYPIVNGLAVMDLDCVVEEGKNLVYCAVRAQDVIVVLPFSLRGSRRGRLSQSLFELLLIVL